MNLGLLLGFWGAEGPPHGLLAGVREAEAIGYESVWTSEGHGSDALTPLAWIGATYEHYPAGHGCHVHGSAGARGHRDGGTQHGPPVGRPVRARPGPVRT